MAASAVGNFLPPASIQQSLVPTTSTPIPRTPTNLSREVLRWLQSLDLAFSVKNPKRDFSNGFLVAEIFSRYYDKDFQMHSFENGQSIKTKKDNWKHLIKIFRRLNMSQIITENEMSGIIHCQDGVVLNFVNRIYEVLTQRRVQKVIKRQLDGPLPPYARQTATAVVGAAMKAPQLAESNDDRYHARIAQDKVQEHEKTLQLERTNNPNRFTAELRTMPPPASPSSDTTEAHKAGAAAPPQVKVIEILVKQMGGNVNTLRAVRDKTYAATCNSAAGSPSPARSGRKSPKSPNSVNFDIPQQHGGIPNPQSVKGGKGSPKNQHAGGGGSPRSCANDRSSSSSSALHILNTTVSNKWRAENEDKRHEANQDLTFSFMSALVEGQVLENVALDIFQDILNQAPALCEAFLAQPTQFWKFVDIFTPMILELTEDSSSLGATVEILCCIGETLRQRDSAATLGLLDDYLLPRLIPAIRQELATSAKLHYTLRILFAYTPQEPMSHYQIIKRLQSAVDDAGAFTKTLAALVFLETDFDENLLDYYLYYAIMGLGNSSPQARGFAVTILSVIAGHRLEWVLSLLPQLQSLAKQDSWWEVQAELLILVGNTLIQVADWEQDRAIVGSLVEIVLEIFRPSAPVFVRKVGLSVLTRFGTYSPSIKEMIVKVLFSLPVDERLGIIGFSSDYEPTIPLPGPEGIYRVRDIARDWNGLEILQEVENDIKSNSLENLEPEHVQVIAAAVISQCEQPVADETSSADNQFCLHHQWTAHFDSLRYHIFVALCDPACCELAAEITRRFVVSSSLQESILRDGAFLGILRLLYPAEGSAIDPRCQKTVQELLREMALKGEVYAAAVKEVLEAFIRDKRPEASSSGLQEILDEIEVPMPWDT